MVHVAGTPVGVEVRGQILSELRRWAASLTSSGCQRERPSIKAESYMILRAPSEFAQAGSTQARKAAAKVAEHRRIWDLAAVAMREVDADFAGKYTALAVTHNFSGSPHIDKVRRFIIYLTYVKLGFS